MAWTGQTFTVGQILTAAQMNNLQADITALANGDTGAPEIQAAALAASIVGQGELKSTTATQSVSVSASSYNEITPTGGSYTMNHFCGTATGYANRSGGMLAPLHDDGTYASKVGSYNEAGIAQTLYLQSRYIQASPPWFYGAVEIQLFILAMLDKNTKEILGTYAAADPPHAYHGPHDLHPIIGRLEKAFGFWGKSLAERRQDPEFLPKLREMNRLKQQGGKELKIVLDENTFTMDEKNIDMNIVPHLFYGFDPAKHVVVMLDPLDPQTEEHALLQELVGIEEIGDNHISQLLHNGYIQIDNTPLDIACPNSVIACKYSMKITQ